MYFDKDEFGEILKGTALLILGFLCGILFIGLLINLLPTCQFKEQTSCTWWKLIDKETLPEEKCCNFATSHPNSEQCRIANFCVIEHSIGEEHSISEKYETKTECLKWKGTGILICETAYCSDGGIYSGEVTCEWKNCDYEKVCIKEHEVMVRK